MTVVESPCSVRVSVDELGSQIVGMAGRLAAATCRWLLLVADFDARDGCARFGLASTAAWLSHACGLSRRTAVEHVRVARGLAVFPTLVQAMSAGRLSYSHVRAITRLAQPGEQRLVTDLIDVAEHGTVGQVETMIRGLRTVQTNSSGLAPDEYVSHSWTPESQWRLTARLDPEHGALVQSAVETIARTEGISSPEALVRMAEIALAATADGSTPHLRGDERAAVVIHLDAAALPTEPTDDAVSAAPADPATRSAERDRPYARIADGPGLPDRVIKRLLCSGRIRTAIHGRGATLRDLGRSHRLVTDRQYRALLLRDHGRCTHPGCTNTRGLEAHHIRHWIHGGRTELANLVLLCPRHHHTHHDGQFHITALGQGRFRFTRGDGTPLPHHINPADHIPTSAPIEADHPHLAGTAATTRWD